MDGGAAAADGRISVGDKLVAVKNLPGTTWAGLPSLLHSLHWRNLISGGDFVLDNCTHEEAVNALKRCKDKVILVVSKAENTYPSSPTISQIQHLPPANFMKPQARSVSEEELVGPRHVSLQKSAAGEILMHKGL